jgi:hypothetical protein
MQELKDALGPGGWVALVAVLVGGLVRLLKSGRLNLTLAWFGVPSIPKAALPWLALALGFAAMTLDAKLGGAAWGAALTAGLAGILSGALAVAGNETLAAATSRLSPKLGAVVFAKRAPPPIPPPKPAT